MAWLIPKGTMGALIAGFPWEGTEFGTLENWPPHLRLLTNLMLESRAPMAIAWGPKFRFLYNDSYRDLIEDKHPAALGEAAEMIFPEFWPTISPLFHQALGGEPVVIEDIELSVRRNGAMKNCYFSGSYTPIRAADGSVDGFLASVVETTARIEQERQRAQEFDSHAGELEKLVKERTGRLQDTIADLESYSYSISHDLRGPLRVMQSFAEALREDCGDEISVTGKDYIRRIVAASERMDRIIQDVLVHSRLSRNEMPLEPLALDEFVPALLDSYPAFHASQADIIIERPLPVVIANHAALSQCLANLIGNATKFVAPGVRPKVVISSRVTAGRAYVSVRDNGIGIPEKDRSVIFNAFHRLNATYEGTGIGLAIVRKAVERMGGHVIVEDAPGGGSIFTFDLLHVQR